MEYLLGLEKSEAHGCELIALHSSFPQVLRNLEAELDLIMTATRVDDTTRQISWTLNLLTSFDPAANVFNVAHKAAAVSVASCFGLRWCHRGPHQQLKSPGLNPRQRQVKQTYSVAQSQ